jgi:hypothetical protein
MGREEERETLAGNRPEHDPRLHDEAEQRGVEVPEPDRKGKSPDPDASAFEQGDPDAVPADVTDRSAYQEALADARREAKNEQAVLEDGRRDMPATSYDDQ